MFISLSQVFAVLAMMLIAVVAYRVGRWNGRKKR